MPDNRICPNIMIVQPPSTASGIDEKNRPIGGINPARIMDTAPVMIVKRFTTFVIAIRPTFWEKEVTGGQPNKEDNADAKPSTAIAPDISSFVISLSNPPDTNAEVSPIVSAAETRKILSSKTNPGA